MPFGNQSLLTLFQPCNESKEVPRDSVTEIANRVLAYFTVERNFDGQVYMQQDLHSSDHCTIPNSSITSIYDAVRSSSVDHPVEYLHVPKSTNYVSPDKRLVVINRDDNEYTALQESDIVTRRPIETVSKLMHKLFKSGIANYFEFDNKKRSSNLNRAKSSSETLIKKTKRGKRQRSSSLKKNQKPNKTVKHTASGSTNNASHKFVLSSKNHGCSRRAVTVDKNALPVVSLGWSTQDCNQYGSNLASVAGNVKPFLRDSNIPFRALSIIANLVETVLSVLPQEWAFNLDKCEDKEVVRLRKEMACEFKEMLSGNRDISNFRVEGITILIPLSIGMHKDSLNCSVEGMRSVVSMNCQVPINEETIPDGKGSKLWVWLEMNGYKETFPCSIILYSRKQVYYICNKMAQTSVFADKELVRKCVSWAFIDRVGSVTDYRSRIWNSESYPNLFKKFSKRVKSSRFKGRMWSSPACYDKTVSLCVYVVWKCNDLANPTHIDDHLHTGILLNPALHIHRPQYQFCVHDSCRLH